MTRLLTASLLGAALLGSPGANAAEPPVAPRIVVTGEGESAAAPDLALLSLSVMREAKTAREALDADNAAMAAVIAALKEAGIADRDLQTAGVQIVPRYNYVNRQDGTQEAEFVAYQVSNTLTVRIRDIATVGEILDRSVTLGVNQGGGIVFANENPATAATEARKRAMADATAKARTLTEAGGVKLGRILEISEVSGAPQPLDIMVKARSFEADAAVPVQPGENTYRVQVTVTFAID